MIGCKGYLVFVVMIAFSGCAKEGSEPADAGGQAEGLTQSVEDGPVRLTVAVDKDRAAIAEPIRLTLTAVAADGVEVKWPELAGELAGLEVRDKSVTTPVALGEGKRRWSQSYTLEGYSGGDYQIPPLVVRYNDLGQAASAATSQPAKTGEVRSEAMSITVASGIQGEADPRAFRDIKPLAAVNLERNWAWSWWSAGVIALGVVVVWLLRWRKRRQEADQADLVIAPHAWALGAFDRLLAEDLVGQGRIHEHYYRLSGITREYIERRFGISAPDMTTEEFLLSIRGGRHLDESQKQALAKFLEACDLVKFAQYRPSSQEIDQAISAAREFVRQTAQREAGDGSSGAVPAEAAA